jgi:hypothetical protein
MYKNKLDNKIVENIQSIVVYNTLLYTTEGVWK